MKSTFIVVLTGIFVWLAGCNGNSEVQNGKQTPASLDPFVAEEITQLDRTSPTQAKSQELFARANDLPQGPQDVIFYARRQETLSLYSKWSGISRTDLADFNEIPDSDKEVPMNTPVTIPMTANDLDRFENARERYHEAYQAAFYSKYTVVELSHHTIARGDSLWKLSRLGELTIPLWLMNKVNPSRDLAVLSVGDTVKIPILVKSAQKKEKTLTFASPKEAPQRPLPAAWPQARRQKTAQGNRVKAPVIAKSPAPKSAPVAASAPIATPTPKKAHVKPMQKIAAKAVPVVPHTQTSTKKPVAEAKTIAPSVPRGNSVTIKVQGGESLSHYSAWSGQSIGKIVSTNGLVNADHLRLGQQLTIPLVEDRVELFYKKRKTFLGERGMTESDAAIHTTPPWKTHLVASGESAWVIAVKQYGISVQALASSNPTINLERLQPGMNLRIPSEMR